MSKVFPTHRYPTAGGGGGMGRESAFPKEFFDGTFITNRGLDYNRTKLEIRIEKMCFRFHIMGKTLIPMNAKVGSTEVIFRGRLHA